MRLPGRTMWTELRFIYDTGASCMSLWSDDIDTLATPLKTIPGEVIQPLVIGQRASVVASGAQQVLPVVELEVTLLDHKDRRMCPWERIPAVVQTGRYIPGRCERLDGPWTRSRFYGATVPDSSFSMHIATDKTSLSVKRIDPAHIVPMVWPVYTGFNPAPFTLGKTLPAVSPRSSPEEAPVPKWEKAKQQAQKLLP